MCVVLPFASFFPVPVTYCASSVICCLIVCSSQLSVDFVYRNCEVCVFILYRYT